jgi:hypothetical protein
MDSSEDGMMKNGTDFVDIDLGHASKMVTVGWACSVDIRQENPKRNHGRESRKNACPTGEE